MSGNDNKKEGRRRAWHDSDDDISDEEGVQCRKTKVQSKPGEKYQSRLDEQFRLVYGPTPSWALKKEETKEDEDWSLKKNLKVPSSQKAKKPKILAQGHLNFLRVGDLNAKNTDSKAKGVLRTDKINTVQFHPTSSVALVADSHGAVTFFQVNGKDNPVVDTMDLAIDKSDTQAAFTLDGKKVYSWSPNPRILKVGDMLSGKVTIIKPNKRTDAETFSKVIPGPENTAIVLGRRGNIHMLSLKSHEFIATMTVNGEVSSACFSESGDKAYTCGESGDIYTWDMKMRKPQCCDKFADEGSLYGKEIAVSSSYLACGSSSGVVNIYELSDTKKPVKVFLNLRTEVNALKFNSSGDLLAMGTLHSQRGLKMVHIPSMTVYDNFPEINVRSRIGAVDFSPRSGYLAAGGYHPYVSLYRLPYFGSY